MCVGWCVCGVCVCVCVGAFGVGGGSWVGDAARGSDQPCAELQFYLFPPLSPLRPLLASSHHTHHSRAPIHPQPPSTSYTSTILTFLPPVALPQTHCATTQHTQFTNERNGDAEQSKVRAASDEGAAKAEKAAPYPGDSRLGGLPVRRGGQLLRRRGAARLWRRGWWWWWWWWWWLW